MCAGEAVSVEQSIERGDDRGLGHASLEPNGNGVERAFHVECRSQSLSADPEDAEASIIAESPAAGEDVFGRKHDADNPQRLALSVEHCTYVIARLEAVDVGERLIDERLIR